MAIEIERKFLVRDASYRNMASAKREIRQGYLNREPERTVRIRTVDNEGYITVKGKNKGAARLEFEYSIPYDDAAEMLGLCIPPVLEKTRYIVPCGGMKWEVDEFHGTKEGLVTAEIELPSEDTPFIKPSFIGEEVTGDAAYYNSNL